MARRRFGLVVLAVAPALALGSGGQARAEVPLALVIGNAAYANLPKLPNCEMSANLVASTLSRAGVKVTRLDNPSNARMGSAIAAVGDEAAAAGSRTLIYVCGYVASYGDRLFLVPVEAKLERDTDVLSQGIVARLLLGAAVAPQSEAGLVLVDAASLPGQKGGLAFDALRRPAEAAHGGLAAADLGAGTAGSPAPLATALADMVGTGSVELGAAMQGLRQNTGLRRALLTVQPPDQASWLLGAAPVAAPAEGAGPPAVVPAAPPPAPAPPPPPVAPPVVTPPVPAAPAVDGKTALAEPNPADRRRVQLGLQRLGYFRGRINGVFGADTLAAIRQFQKDSQAEPTGKLTVGQMQELLQ